MNNNEEKTKQKKNWPSDINNYKMNYLIRYGSYGSEIYYGFCDDKELENIPLSIKIINLEIITDIEVFRVIQYFFNF
jgi:hypothetical protein